MMAMVGISNGEDGDGEVDRDYGDGRDNGDDGHGDGCET